MGQFSSRQFEAMATFAPVSGRGLVALLALLAIPRALNIWHTVHSCGGGTAFVLNGGAEVWAAFFVMMGGSVPGACRACPAGRYRAGDYQPPPWCQICPEGSWSEEGSTRCTCIKGWTREVAQDVTTCVRCPANSFKAVGGSAPCVPCPFNWVTMQEGSDDVMQCLPADVISAVSSGWTMLLKSSGVLAEEPHERRWRQKATSEVSDYLSTMADKTVATTRTSVQSAGEALSWLLGQLQACIADLFDKMQDFYKQRCAEWKRASSPDVCTSERSQKRWLISQEDYNYWRQAASRVRVRPSPEGCRQMKSAARRVLLLVHPDKFLALHPSCKGYGSSEVLARDFNREYQILKESCQRV